MGPLNGELCVPVTSSKQTIVIPYFKRSREDAHLEQTLTISRTLPKVCTIALTLVILTVVNLGSLLEQGMFVEARQAWLLGQDGLEPQKGRQIAGPIQRCPWSRRHWSWHDLVIERDWSKIWGARKLAVVAPGSRNQGELWNFDRSYLFSLENVCMWDLNLSYLRGRSIHIRNKNPSVSIVHVMRHILSKWARHCSFIHKFNAFELVKTPCAEGRAVASPLRIRKLTLSDGGGGSHL